MAVSGDVSMNSRLFLNEYSIYFNGQLFSGTSSYFINDVSMTKTLLVQGDVTFNNRLFVGTDLSVNGRVNILGDASMNNRMFVNSDVSLNSKMAVSGDVSMNNRLFVAKDASFNKNLSVIGNVAVSSLLKTTTISESFVPINTSSSTYTLDFFTGSTFYISAPPMINFTCNIINLPADINRTYVITVIITTTYNKTYCNSVQINSNTAITPYFSNSASIDPFVNTNVITQSIAVQRIAVGDVIPNLNILSSVVGWY
jgi:hypothetical protein